MVQHILPRSYFVIYFKRKTSTNLIYIKKNAAIQLTKIYRKIIFASLLCLHIHCKKVTKLHTGLGWATEIIHIYQSFTLIYNQAKKDFDLKLYKFCFIEKIWVYFLLIFVINISHQNLVFGLENNDKNINK